MKTKEIVHSIKLYGNASGATTKSGEKEKSLTIQIWLKTQFSNKSQMMSYLMTTKKENCRKVRVPCLNPKNAFALKKTQLTN